MQSFKLYVSDLLPKTLEEVKTKIKAVSIPLTQVKFTDLVLFDPIAGAESAKPLLYGVYLLLYGGEQGAYVGKTTKGFVYRLGEQFCTIGRKVPTRSGRKRDNPNPLLRNAHEKMGQLGDVDFHRTAAEVCQLDPHLALVAFDGWPGGQAVKNLETTLQAVYCPGPGEEVNRWFVKRLSLKSLQSKKMAVHQGSGTFAELSGLAQ